jgi:hypothetical protein
MEKVIRKFMVVKRTSAMRIQEALISAIASSNTNFVITEGHSFSARVQKSLTNVQAPNCNEFIRKLNAIARYCLG